MALRKPLAILAIFAAAGLLIGVLATSAQWTGPTDPPPIGNPILVNGTGLANQVTTWTDADTIQGDTGLTYNAANDQLSIGTTTTPGRVDVSGNDGTNILLRLIRGTAANPTEFRVGTDSALIIRTNGANSVRFLGAGSTLYGTVNLAATTGCQGANTLKTNASGDIVCQPDNDAGASLATLTRGSGLSGLDYNGTVARTWALAMSGTLTCPAGQHVSAITAVGVVTCSPDTAPPPALATLTRGSGLTGSNYNGSVAATFAVDTAAVQARNAAASCAGSVLVDINADGTFVCEADDTGGVTGGAANKVAFWTGASALSNNANFHWDNTNTRLGIGTASPQATLSLGNFLEVRTNNTAPALGGPHYVRGVTGAGGHLVINANSTAANTGTLYLNFTGDPSGGGPVRIRETLFVNPGGDVGIGTATPLDPLGWAGALDVAGSVKGARYYDDDPSYYADLNAGARVGGNWTFTGVIGFGNGGTINSTPNLHLDAASGASMYLNYSTGQRVYICNAGTGCGSGTVFISNSAALSGYGDWTLEAGGGGASEIYAGAFYHLSDRTLKTNIQPLPRGSLAKILALQGVSFDWIESEGGAHSVGLIAQDVEPLFPDVVTARGDGKKTIDYGKLTVPLIEAVKEQQAEIGEQQGQIEELRAKAESQDRKIAQLEAERENGASSFCPAW